MARSKAPHQGHPSAFKQLEKNKGPCIWELDEQAQIPDCQKLVGPMASGVWFACSVQMLSLMVKQQGPRWASGGQLVLLLCSALTEQVVLQAGQRLIVNLILWH